MDVSYNPHAERARRKNRSSTNINHLTLAPLTAKLPLNDVDAVSDSNAPFPRPSTSYLQGKSAPTTPRLLVSSATKPHSRSRSHNRTPSAPGEPITKSKSSSHLVNTNARRAVSGTTTPRQRHDDKADGDWLLRTGAFMTFEAREYKGQAWLVSRQSSTSLTGTRDADEEAFERELAREREMTSRRASRRGSLSLVTDDDMSIIGSKVPSRFNSRSHSIVENRSQLLTPLDRVEDDSYFPTQEYIPGPDFVDLDEKLEQLEQDTADNDEADVKRLLRRSNSGKGSWMSNVIGWSLFSVDEHEEDPDEDSEDDDALGDSRSLADRSAWLKRHCEGPLDPEDLIPPPRTDEGGWSDAAWLLSVASKVIF